MRRETSPLWSVPVPFAPNSEELLMTLPIR